MSQPVGLWLIGARGGVATVATIGLAALRKGLTQVTGLVTELPDFSDLDLVDWADVIVGGHDIRNTSLVDEARRFQQSSRALPDDLIEQTADDLRQVNQRIQPGQLYRCGNAIDQLADASVRDHQLSAQEVVSKIRSDLAEFKSTNGLASAIIVNVASTELPVAVEDLPASWSQAESSLDRFPVSSLYAIAAMQEECAYVNFTPSLGSDCPALIELASNQGVVHAGRDGKTGETLLKSALAPMFAMRHLNVMSWVGHNIFGNMDGQVLDDPANKQTKVQSKDRLLGEILGYSPQSHISIEYIKSLGDWKTAWDHIHFQGFLGTPMTMQFTWQGCDSILAAPLVLDLFRLAERAVRAGDSGVMDWLACFFKSPMCVAENCLVQQYQMLKSWASRVRSAN